MLNYRYVFHNEKLLKYLKISLYFLSFASSTNNNRTRFAFQSTRVDTRAHFLHFRNIQLCIGSFVGEQASRVFRVVLMR